MAVTRNGFICSGLTGGGTGALDAKVSTDIIGVAFAITVDTAKVYFHYYDSTSAAAESSPDVIKPDDLGVGVAGRWLLLDVWIGLAAVDAIGALTPAANKMVYFTSASAASLADLTAAARTLLALSATAGDLLYASGANTWANLAKGAANTKAFMNAGATAPEWAAGINIISTTFDTATASGDVAVTGVGFKPSTIICLSGIDSTQRFSVGFSYGTTELCIKNYGGSFYPGAYLWSYESPDPGTHVAIVKSLDADGFTITTTKGAGCTGTLVLYYLCIR